VPVCGAFELRCRPAVRSRCVMGSGRRGRGRRRTGRRGGGEGVEEEEAGDGQVGEAAASEREEAVVAESGGRRVREREGVDGGGG